VNSPPPTKSETAPAWLVQETKNEEREKTKLSSASQLIFFSLASPPGV
jgi:hypothetical protein